jgi:Mce-associated membrane protein
VAVLVLALASGAGLLVRAAQLTGDDAARNQALTDRAATSRVSGEVGDALARIFSYTPEGVAGTEQSARDVLDGKAARQYEALFGQVGQRVAEQRLTLASRVVSSGVTRLHGDRAHLLVFLDQTSSRPGHKPAHAGAQLSVTAERQDGDWRIVAIKAR